MEGRRVHVVGDTIVDSYTYCAMIGGQTAPTRGRISLFGKNTTGLPPRDAIQLPTLMGDAVRNRGANSVSLVFGGEIGASAYALMAHLRER